MFSVSKVGNKYLAIHEPNFDEAQDDIYILVTSGTPVILVDELEELEDLNIDLADVEIINT